MGLATLVGLGAPVLPAAQASAPEVATVPGSPPAPLPPGTQEDGPLASSTPLHLVVSLPSRDPAGLAEAVKAVSTPGDRSYRRFIRPAEFASRYGASPALIAQVRAELTALGVPPGPVSANGLSMPILTTASRAQSAFRTSIRRTRLPDGRQAFADVTRPAYPAGVQSVAGLENVKRLSRSAVPSATPALLTLPPTACTSAAARGGHTPAQLSSAYDLGGLYSRGLSGAGTTIAVYELAGFQASDVAAYQSCYGTSASVTAVAVDGGAPLGSGTVEATADVEIAASTAPGAQILSYEAPNTSVGNIDNWNQLVGDDRASIISTSWGICESDVSPSDTQTEANILAEAALQGQTVLAASGDDGSNAACGLTGSTIAQLAVSDPASQPGVTAVGGTNLQSVANPRSEVAWDDPGIGASGGGNSANWPRPSWQQGTGVSSPYSSVACSLAGGCREVPDVAASASPATGYPVYCTAGDCAGLGLTWGLAGGTSLGAPLWAGMLALVEQSCSGRLGFLNPVLYQHPRDFFDVSSGDTDWKGDNNGDFPATAGYDMATGLGSPDGDLLAADVCSTPPPPPPPPTSEDSSYWTVASDGGIFSFGSAPFLGSMGGMRLNQPIVGMARDPATGGYWLVASDGGVFSFGAPFYGSTGGMRLNQPIVGMAATPDGHGYWLVASDGGIFSFGDAAFHGSTGGLRLNRPVVGMAPDPPTGGYWLVASDGGVFSFGAPFYGSTGGMRLNQPIVGMTALANGTGYRFVASDGGVFDFGAARFLGSTGGLPLNRPVVGMADTPDDGGYWLVASDGGVFNFGAAEFSGSTGAVVLNRPVVGLSPAE